MNSKIERTKNTTKISVSVTPKEMVKYFKTVYEKISQDVKIPGFRPGKAPRKLIEETIGISRLVSESVDQVINASYFEAVRENKISPLSAPNITINKHPKWGLTEEEIENDLEYMAEVEVFPQVTPGDYTKVKVDLKKSDKPKKEDVDKVFEQLQRQKASYNEIDREAKNGDLAEISFEGKLKGVRIDEMCSKNFPVVLGNSSLIPGFEENIVGMKKCDKKSFKIKFPANYHKKDYASKEAEFSVELLNLKEVILPNLDDKFALDFGQKSIDEMKSAIEKNLSQEMEVQAKNETETKVIEKVLPLLKVDLPEILINQEIDRMIHDYSHQLESMKITLDKYLADMKKSKEELRKDMKPQAEKNIKVGLLLGEIARENKINPDDKEAGRKALDLLVSKLTNK